jgi:hypothetical protein
MIQKPTFASKYKSRFYSVERLASVDLPKSGAPLIIIKKSLSSLLTGIYEL